MKKVFLTVAMAVTALLCHAQIDTVYHLDSKSIKKYLKPSVNQYLVFIQRKDNPQLTMTWIWSREVRFIEKNHEATIEIVQKWYASDTARNRFVYSLVRARDFSPLYHYTKMSKGIEAFDFYSDRIQGSDSVANNTRKEFNLKSDHALLNWELDLETFPLLDLKMGKRFVINFSHPGGSPPKLYEYRVVSEENLKVPEGYSVPCWKLRIDYNEKSWAIFYISKKGREVLKMEEDFGAGIRYKVKLSNSIDVR